MNVLQENAISVFLIQNYVLIQLFVCEIYYKFLNENCSK